MQHMVRRRRLEDEVSACLAQSPAVALLGPRQTGKTTLSRVFAEKPGGAVVFDLERAAARSALATPELTLSDCRGLVIIDEVQRMPGLFEALRPLCDRPDRPAKFLLLGSASPALVRGVSESLAGRVVFVRVGGFTLDEVGAGSLNRLWLRGGLPRAYLASDSLAWERWTDSFVTALLERDIPQLGVAIPSETLRRFWMMLAHCHSQAWNSSGLARSMGVSPNTARHYLDVLCGLFLARALPPWHENLAKRQVKSPKVYIRDSGILHFLLGLPDMARLRGHPGYGASWEGFALEQTLSMHGDRGAYFWGTQRGAELDLLLIRGATRYGFEFKCADAPSMTRSMHLALEDLKLGRLFVVFPGKDRYRLHERVEALPLAEVPSLALA